jgi:hypothetical protein
MSKRPHFSRGSTTTSVTTNARLDVTHQERGVTYFTISESEFDSISWSNDEKALFWSLCVGALSIWVQCEEPWNKPPAYFLIGAGVFFVLAIRAHVKNHGITKRIRTSSTQVTVSRDGTKQPAVPPSQVGA